MSSAAAELIPASSLLPAAFNDSKPEFYWAPSEVAEGGSSKLYLTSEVHAGWKYFTLNREVRLSQEYPKGYEDEIGYKYNHGPGKTDKDGRPLEEKAKPRSVWMVRAWLVEEERMVAAVIDSFTLQSRISKILQNEEYGMTPTGVCNFYLTIFREANPATPAATYDATGALRVLRNKRAHEEAAKPFFPENYWRGLNPLEAGAEPPEKLAAVLPPTARDENGADAEVTVGAEGDYKW